MKSTTLMVLGLLAAGGCSADPVEELSTAYADKLLAAARA